MTGLRIRRRTGGSASVSLIACALLLASACGGSRKPVPAAETSPSVSPPASAGSPSPTHTEASAPSPSASARQGTRAQGPAPAYRLSKTVTFGGIAFSVPEDWGIHVDGDTAFVGVLAGGPNDVMLRVQRNFAGSIDTLKPTSCPREGDPAEPAVSVETAESGLRPIGDKKAEFRLWRVTCPSSGVREHRAWLLPTSKIAIYEQVHEGHPENVDVVSGAQVR